MFLITKDLINTDPFEPTCIGVTSSDYILDTDLPYQFRILDGDKEVYFYGLSDDNSSFDPLDNLGTAFGCTSIEYLENGEWKEL
jgi:hypothetical protein